MINRQRFDRNLGFLSGAEQERIQDATIAIAGGGGDGGEVARLLTRMGAGAGKGELRLADPDTFEIENINRQTACTAKTIGMNKAEAVGELLDDVGRLAELLDGGRHEHRLRRRHHDLSPEREDHRGPARVEQGRPYY